MLGALLGLPLWGGCRDRQDAASQGLSHATAEAAPPLRAPPGVLVAHALGRIDGMGYTNSLEALRCNHGRGFRWFEVDLALTRDAGLVAFHTQHERNAGMERPIHELSLAEVRGSLYRGRYPIVTFADVLSEARGLGDVVFVTDTKTWSEDMLRAVERVVMETPEPRPQIALQAYSDKHLAAVAELAGRLGGGVIFTLYKSRAPDHAVATLAKQYGLVAVVASEQRFSPWLAERLDAVGVPILVHTVNEHEQIVKLSRAGADGFYTDSYVPYNRFMADRPSLLDCGADQPSEKQLRVWLRRDLHKAKDFRMATCARRQRGHVALQSCGTGSALTGVPLPVPPESHVRIELEVESASTDVDFWFQVVAKDGLKRPREELHLSAGERRTFSWDVAFASGSAGLETRLGLRSGDARLNVVRLETTLVVGEGPRVESEAPHG